MRYFSFRLLYYFILAFIRIKCDK